MEFEQHIDGDAIPDLFKEDTGQFDDLLLLFIESHGIALVRKPMPTEAVCNKEMKEHVGLISP